jgi:hypothetical protein
MPARTPSALIAAGFGLARVEQTGALSGDAWRPETAAVPTPDGNPPRVYRWHRAGCGSRPEGGATRPLPRRRRPRNRNDTEEAARAADVIAFDRMVTHPDRDIPESTNRSVPLE